MRTSYHRTLLLVSTCLPIANGLAWAQTPYRMEGIVTDADAQRPVPNATVQVVIESESDLARRLRTSQSNDEGRYSIELPAGHAWAWILLPPAGYCPMESGPGEKFATTDDHPVFTKNYQVRKGIPLCFAVRYPDTLADPPKTFVSLGQQREDEYVSAFCEIDNNGTGKVTLLQLSGKFSVDCGDKKRTLVVPDCVELDFEKGFDPSNALPDAARRDDGTAIVRDANGAAVTLRGCDAIVDDGQLTIAIDVDGVRSESVAAQLEGRIVDADGNGVQGASVTVDFYPSDGHSAPSPIVAAADNSGRFSVGIPELTGNTQVGFLITREGYGGLETKPMDLAAAANGKVSVGTFELGVGCSARVRVLGPDGSPLHGAVVEPLNDRVSRGRIARTGPDGVCQLTDLAAGLMRIVAAFGTLGASTKVPLAPGENGLVVVKVRPPSTRQPQQPPTLAAGTAAPEWTIAEWTDGKRRGLSDYRGQVVVLDFWGVWCGACINEIPVMKELHDRYKDRDVVFLGIHTAGADMVHVKRLLEQQKWDLTVGVDTGEDVLTGETVRRYAILGYPTVMVVDRKGTIVFNSSDLQVFQRTMETMAGPAGLPRPTDQDVSEEEATERLLQRHVVTLGRVIDDALKTRAD